MESTGQNTKSRARQAWELARLELCRSHKVGEYYVYRFHEKDKDYRYMLQFLSNRDNSRRFRPAVNDRQWKVVLDNKWLFHLHYGAFGLPTTEVLGHYEPEGGFSRDGKPLRSAGDLRRVLEEVRPTSLVVKPVGGIQGKGLLILDRLEVSPERIVGTTLDGRRLEFEDIVRHVTQDHGVRYSGHRGHELYMRGYLLEQRLEQHPFLAEINPHTTNTLRLVTFAHASGEVDIDFAVARLGRKGNMADNWEQGGVSVHLDVTTGRLGRGVLKPKHGGHWVDRHPDTGIRFEGRQMPMWSEIAAVCQQAARLTPLVRSVGWDVILTPNGPRLLEGNPDWDLAMVQVHSEGYLQPQIRDRLKRYGLEFPVDRLPPADPVGTFRGAILYLFSLMRQLGQRVGKRRRPA